MMLQGRLAALNPSRTIVLRGVVRPGTLVEENELQIGWIPTDVFRMEWTGLQVNSASSLPLIAMECSINYCTDGTAGNGGMDRGRLLAGMDVELMSAVGAEPHTVEKMDYAAAGAGVAPVAMRTNVFWADPAFGAVSAIDGRLARTLMLQVFAYQEAGEL